MKTESVAIGLLSTVNNVFVAPLAGFSDVAFRSLCYKLGAGLCFTEMVSAKGLFYGGSATEQLLKTADNEYIKAVQIFGDDPDIMRAVADRYLGAFDIIDINMGCPVPKVFNNGEGSALLEKPEVAERIVSTLVKGGHTVTVKMRLGVERGKSVAVEFGKRMEQAGASMITLHARYKDQYYSGEPDYAECAALKSAVSVPVIFNGGVFSDDDAVKALTLTGANGVMIARGAINTPWLICELLGKPCPDKKALIKEHISSLCDTFGEKVACVNFRKQMALYLKSVRGGKKLKERAFAATTKSEYSDIIEGAEFF